MTGRAVLGLLALYLLWGVNYLAVRWAVAALPPFFMAGSRYLAAGLLLWAALAAAARLRRAAPPRAGRKEWGLAAVGGGAFVFCGDGGIAFAEQYIDSSLAALLVATIPLWMALGVWAWGLGPRPRPPVWLALALGFGGIALLVDPVTPAAHYRLGVAVMLGLSFVWTLASLYLKQEEKKWEPPSPLRLAALQMVCGGGALLAFSAAAGETLPARIDARAWTGYGYLFVGDCLLGFPLYLWLLRTCPPLPVSTYAFMCPLVALLAGITLGGEAFSPAPAEAPP